MSSIQQAFYQLFMKGTTTTDPDEPVDPDKPEVWGYWSLPTNYAARSEIRPPRGAEPNLFFTKADFQKINLNKGNHATRWNNITASSDPVAVAIEGNVIGDAAMKTSAFNSMHTEVKRWVDMNLASYHENTKNAFCVLWAAYIVYDWCKDVMGNTVKDAFIADCDNLMAKGNGIQSNNDISKHTARIAGHGFTFYQHHDLKSVAFYDRKPGLWQAFLDDKFNSDGRLVVNEFAQSGMSVHGTYSAIKMSGMLGQEWALRSLLPAGKTMYHPNLKFLAYDLFFRFKENKSLLLHGEYNDQHYGYSNGTFDYRLYNQLSTLYIHAAMYNDAAVMQIIEDLPNLRLFAYDAKVTPHIFNAAVILHGLTPSGNYADVPRVKRTYYPLTNTIYRNEHSFTQNNSKRILHVELNAHETWVGGGHTMPQIGHIQIAGRGGWNLTGAVGGRGSTFDGHHYNWHIGGFGLNTFVLIEPTEKWDMSWDPKTNSYVSESKKINTGTPRYALNHKNDPKTYSDYIDPARGYIWGQSVSKAQDNESDPKYVFDCVDLSKAYRGISTFFKDRVNKYTRSVTTIPLNRHNIPSNYDGLVLVMDKVDVIDTTRDYFQQWQAYKTPVRINEQKIRFDPIQGTGIMYMYNLVPSDGNISFETGWKNHPPGNSYPVPEVGNGDRVLVRPYVGTRLNTFLTAFLVTDSGVTGYNAADFNTITQNGYVQIDIEGWVVVQSTEHYINFDSQVSFTITGGSTRNILVTHLEPGNWSVNGGAAVEVAAGFNCLHFTGGAGTYTLNKVS